MQRSHLQTAHSQSASPAAGPRGVEHAGVIDLMSHDTRANMVTLRMVEQRPWDGSEVQRFQLQEKLNAYLSFALDGEMLEAYPQLAGAIVRLELECAEAPVRAVLHLLGMVREQIAFQGIELLVTVNGARETEPGCGCEH